MACLAINHARVHSWTVEEMALVEETAERICKAVARVCADAALAKSDRCKDEFLTSLAHELRNQLAYISNARLSLWYFDGKRRADDLLAMVEPQVGPWCGWSASEYTTPEGQGLACRTPDGHEVLGDAVR